jgi:hypothetical protein
VSHQSAVSCDRQGCKASAQHDPEDQLPGAWGEINIGAEWLHFCCSRHAIDFLMSHTQRDGSWTNKRQGTRPHPRPLAAPRLVSIDSVA